MLLYQSQRNCTSIIIIYSLYNESKTKYGYLNYWIIITKSIYCLHMCIIGYLLLIINLYKRSTTTK